MTYKRVIPRDLFNEASLLKCLGRLYILTDGRDTIELTHRGGRFDIEQSEDDGSISCPGVMIVIGGRLFTHRRPLNSREPWPLYVRPAYDDESDDIAVFDDNGDLTPEFKGLLP